MLPTWTGVYALAALPYALATGGETDPVLAVPRLLWEMLLGLQGRWMAFWAARVTGLLLGAVLLGFNVLFGRDPFVHFRQ